MKPLTDVVIFLTDVFFLLTDKMKPLTDMVIVLTDVFFLLTDKMKPLTEVLRPITDNSWLLRQIDNCWFGNGRLSFSNR